MMTVDDANPRRDLLAKRSAEAAIPSTTSRSAPIPYDKAAYRARKLSAALIIATVTYWLN